MVYGTLVGPLTAGTTYYLDLENEAETPKLKEYALQYVERSKARKVTWRDDESALRRLWIPILGRKRLHEVLPGEVELIK